MEKSKKQYRVKRLPIVIAAVMLLAIATAIFVFQFTRPAHLPVHPVLQKPELPNGCEITSLAIVLQYMGFDVTKEELSDNFLEKQDFYTKDGVKYGGDPERVFAGNPRETTGFYCFEKPIVEAANRYLASVNSDKKAYAITGADINGLEKHLSQGTPVILWTILFDNASDPVYSDEAKWIIEDTGKEYVPLMNSHCVVLIGQENGALTVSDPLSGANYTSKSTMDFFEKMGSRAIVIE